MRTTIRLLCVSVILCAVTALAPWHEVESACPYCSQPVEDQLRNCSTCNQSLSPPPVVSVGNLAWCNNYLGHWDGKYHWQERYCKSDHQGSFPTKSCGSPYSTYGQTYRSTRSDFVSTLIIKSNACWVSGCGSIPSGCNITVPTAAPTSTPTPGPSPTSGGVPTPTPGGMPSGCEGHDGKSCNQIPCSCRAYYNCSPCAEPTVVPTATPTPTPTPFCSLYCPGTEPPIQELSPQFEGNGGGIESVSPVPVPISGLLSYRGYNNFVCDTYDDGWGNIRSCPPSEEGGGFGGFGLTSWWDKQVNYNMLCGEQNHAYSPVVYAGSGSGGAQGEPNPTPTDKLNPTGTLSSRYPPSCLLGTTSTPGPTPTPDIIGDVSQGQGGGAGSGTGSCTCSVIASCQEHVQLSPNINKSECNDTCNFQVQPEYPVYDTTGINVSFTVDANEHYQTGMIYFNDGSTPETVDLENGEEIDHTFINAGAYDVALVCEPNAPIACTRTLHVYCDNNIAPTPTIAPTASPTPTPTPGTWFKVKDSSFHSTIDIQNRIPESVDTFDESGQDSGRCDPTSPLSIRCMSIGEPGIITSQGDEITTGTAPFSYKSGWSSRSYTRTNRLTPTSFISYIRARKPYVEITSLEEGQKLKDVLEAGKVHLWTGGDLALNNDDFDDTRKDFVFVVQDANVTIENSLTNLQTSATAVVINGDLAIESEVSQLYGIYMARAVDFASDISDGETTPIPLKVNGNIISLTSNSSVKKRDRGGEANSKPSVFIVLGIDDYRVLWPYLHTRNYSMEELKP